MIPRSLRPSRNELFEKFERMLIEKAEWALAKHGKGESVRCEQGQLDILRIELAIMKAARKLSQAELQKLKNLSNLAKDVISAVGYKVVL